MLKSRLCTNSKGVKKTRSYPDPLLALIPVTPLCDIVHTKPSHHPEFSNKHYNLSKDTAQFLFVSSEPILNNVSKQEVLEHGRIS